ncbi:hypothetical protein [Congregicoccus parvus]|uniref:hypothetical protein n=1 Tax=Congregicoccus parvus TaxID=3081749 RepID=UPI003FA52567
MPRLLHPFTVRTGSLCFCLPLLVLGITAPTSAQATFEPFRLERVAVVQFTAIDDATIRRTTGVLTIDGTILWRPSNLIERPTGMPEYALDRLLIERTHWAAYRSLGTTAMRNFELQEGGVFISFGGTDYLFIGLSTEPVRDIGTLVNISNRVRLTDHEDVAITGFVIEDRPRRVLVRAVGPSLLDHGVGDAAEDPFLRIMRGDTRIHFAADWAARPEHAEIREATARVGAFPLREDSLDAACLVTLAPGAYTVQVASTPDSVGGTVLAEIYIVPEDW